LDDEGWREALIEYLEPFDVYLVGLHRSFNELTRREAARALLAVLRWIFTTFILGGAMILNCNQKQGRSSIYLGFLRVGVLGASILISA